ncbi:acetylornithine deacetylase [Roseovarius spongiae]|uniref:Acetylornithine deacetylase n=1 Tax=Roseovarius spongiae TaxID=2320272 RepID=A0A3A8AY49_9RHOB|nr:acetylornithine deacetylase [Roseovarius spongiae]RKF16847.1 acetylornithine deacetylase [Roseovarius spongiae]
MHRRMDDTVALLSELIAFPTVSETSNLALVDLLASRLEDAGANVHIFPDDTGLKANLFATLGPERDGGIVLSGHSDVVPVADQEWRTDPFALHDAEGRLYGRGACDMKGFIAAAVAMAPDLAAMTRDRPLHFSFTYDEETGCFGARALTDSLAALDLRPAIALIGEPTEMQVIEGHKGCFEYSTHFHGLAGHGSGPDKGVNAVEYAARFVARLLTLKDQLRARAPANSRFEPPWTTINTGALIGGVAHNVIPSTARVDWEMRPVQDSDAALVKDDLHRFCEETLLAEMRQVCPDADIVTEIIGEVAGLIPTDPNAARDIVMELTGAKGADVVPFGTEAGIFQAYGMSVVVCGPGSIDQAHKADEFVSHDQLGQCLTMLERLGERIALRA